MTARERGILTQNLVNMGACQENNREVGGLSRVPTKVDF
jgi:hypothetical protein